MCIRDRNNGDGVRLTPVPGPASGGIAREGCELNGFRVGTDSICFFPSFETLGEQGGTETRIFVGVDPNETSTLRSSIDGTIILLCAL